MQSSGERLDDNNDNTVTRRRFTRRRVAPNARSWFSSKGLIVKNVLVTFALWLLVFLSEKSSFCNGDDDVKCPTSNEFQTLSPITQPSPIEEMEWLARYDYANKDDHTKKTERVIAKLSNGQIYQSKDNGKTFADETAVLRGFQEDKGFIVDRILVPSDDLYTKRVILQGNKVGIGRRMISATVGYNRAGLKAPTTTSRTIVSRVRPVGSTNKGIGL